MNLKGGMSAQLLRVILFIVLLILLGGAGVGFYVVQQQLRSFAESTNSLNQQASQSDSTLKQLQQLQLYLASHKSDIALAQNVTSTSQGYLKQMIHDLTAIASDSGVTISQFGFSSSGSSATSGTNTSTGTPTAGSVSPASPSSAAVSGVKTESVTITLNSPLPYMSLLKFINDVENNPTRMQISSLNVSGDNSGNVSISTLTIEIYVR